MSNGGYKGASPARETSPEQYPGVWELTEQFQAQADGNWPFQAGDCAPKGLKFDGSSSNLERTFTAAGNRTAWSWSCWLKRGKMNSGRQVVFGSYNAADDSTWLEFGVDNTNAYYTTNSIAGSSNAALRDPAAFYHYFANFDGSTFKIFINNVEVLSSTSLAGTRGIAGRYRHRIGQSPASHAGNIRFFDGVMAECHFLDGQILSPSDFAFYDGQGIWQPKRFTGDYSSGPVYSANSTGGAFYSTFTWADAFDGKLNTGPFVYSSTTNTLTLPPGVTWSNSIRVYALRYDGAFEVNGTNILSSHTITTTAAWHDLTTTLGSSGTLSTITIGGVNTNYFKLFAVELDGQILTNPSVGVNSFHLDFSDGVTDQSGLGNHWTPDGIALRGDGTIYSDSLTSTATFSANNPRTYGFDGSIAGPNVPYVGGSADAIVWTPPGGYSYSQKIEMYVGGVSGFRWNLNGGGWNTATINSWNTVAVGSGTITTLSVDRNGSGTHGWHALKVDGQILIDGQYSDVFVDSPVNGNESSTAAGGERRGNYATLNPLNTGSNITLKDANLGLTSSGHSTVLSTIAVTAGMKTYMEAKVVTDGVNGWGLTINPQADNNYSNKSGKWWVYDNGVNFSIQNESTSTPYGVRVNANDILQLAIDYDAGKAFIGVNNTWINSTNGTNGNPSTGANPTFTFSTEDPIFPLVHLQSGELAVNFGQRSFVYAAPSDFSPLATSFLPEPSELAKNPSKAFDILLWSGGGPASDRTISGIDMESGPDMVWSKTRNHGYHHNIFDAVRGFGTSGGAPLTTDYKDGQATGGVVKSTDSTSVTWEKASNNAYVWYNETGKNYVSWLWDAGTATTSVAVGGSNSQAFDQSQRWRDNITSSNGWNTSYPVNNIFNGAFDGGGGAANNGGGGTITFTPPAAITVTKLELSCYSEVTLGLPDGTTQTIAGVGGLDKSVEANIGSGFSFTGSNSITISRNGGFIYLERIRINGKELVDDDITINTPEAACDVRANPEAGFSIVKVDNPNSTEARVHGLSKAPDFIIAKAIASGNTQHYHMFHSYYGRSNYATFTGDAWAGSDQWGSQEPNSTSFYVKANTGSGANYAGGMIYYIWHAVENYSAMGSYVGNGASDGPMVYLGFEPKWVLVKGASGSTFWRIWDATREPNNAKVLTFSPNSALAETTWAADDIDFLSNGFKIRSNGSYHNNQFQTYLYVAFAANPFASNIRAH